MIFGSLELVRDDRGMNPNKRFPVKFDLSGGAPSTLAIPKNFTAVFSQHRSRAGRVQVEGFSIFVPEPEARFRPWTCRVFRVLSRAAVYKP